MLPPLSPASLAVPVTVRRPDPVNLDEADRHLFAKAAERTLPPSEVTIHRDVEAAGRGPLRSRSGYLAGSFVTPQQLETWKRRRGHWRAAAERCLTPAEPLDEPAVWITDNWSCGYFHWFCDALPRLERTLAEYPAGELTLLLPAKFRRSAYFLDSLQPFGLRRVRVLRRFQRLRCRELLLPSHLSTTGNYVESIMRRLRQRFRDHCGLPAEPSPKRLYLSRRLAGRRRIANESQLLPVLARHGFSTVTAERLSWRQQVQRFAAARYLVSNHGAGLTNALVMPPGTAMMEIRADGDDHHNCYFSLAGAMQLDYFYVLAPRRDSRESVHRGDVVVDPRRLDDALAAMTAGGDAARVA